MTSSFTSFPANVEEDPSHLAAAEWFVRLQGPEVSLEDTLAWQAWLSENPANALAYARIEEVSQVVRVLPAPRGVPSHELARDRYDGSIPLRDWRGSAEDWRGRRRAPHRLRWPWVAGALAAACAGVAFSIVLWSTPSATRFSTTVGENRHITLTDGSTISLSGDTQVAVVLSKTARTVELVRGEALFKVVRDVVRPFKVRAGNATIVAVGTAFDIQRNSDRAVVSVTEGRVLVEPTADFLPAYVLREFKPNLRTVRLDAGEQTTAGGAGIAEPSKVEDPAAATAWQTGRLAFHLQPLRYVLENVNRYSNKPIVLAGDSLGSLVITGTVERENISGWVGSLERAFDLEAVEEADRIVLRPR